MKTQKLKISGMHCTSCAFTIDFDLEDLGGVISAKTNYASQETVVTFDETRISLDKIIAFITKSGYTAHI